VISAGSVSISGSISSNNDTDYYRLTLGAGKTLTAALSMASNVNFNLYLYRSNGSSLLASSSQGTGVTERISYTNTGTTAATVYLRVLRSSGTGSYTLIGAS
jgi:serine protease